MDGGVHPAAQAAGRLRLVSALRRRDAENEPDSPPPNTVHQNQEANTHIVETRALLWMFKSIFDASATSLAQLVSMEGLSAAASTTSPTFCCRPPSSAASIHPTWRASRSLRQSAQRVRQQVLSAAARAGPGAVGHHNADAEDRATVRGALRYVGVGAEGQ